MAPVNAGAFEIGNAWQKDKKTPLMDRLRWYHYLGATLGFVMFYQITLMYLWTAYPQYDTFLLRFSLSNSDAMSISAWALAIWSMHLLEKKSKQMAQMAAQATQTTPAQPKDRQEIKVEGAELNG